MSSRRSLADVLARMLPKPVYAQETLPGQRPPGVWRGRVVAAALFLFLLVFFAGLLILPATLPFRDRQNITFNCDSGGALGLCDQPATVAHFFAQVCGRQDVILAADQSEYRKRIEAGELTAEHFTLSCRRRTVRIEGTSTLETRGDTYLTEGGRTRQLYEAWLAGSLSAGDARERLLGTP